MASKRLERKKDKFKFTATDVEADQYSMMTRPDHWSEHKYVLLQIPVFNCLHCFHPFSRHLCECQQLCESLCWKLHPVWAAHMQFWKSQPKSAQFCFQMLEDASAKYLLLSYPNWKALKTLQFNWKAGDKQTFSRFPIGFHAGIPHSRPPSIKCHGYLCNLWRPSGTSACNDSCCKNQVFLSIQRTFKLNNIVCVCNFLYCYSFVKV